MLAEDGSRATMLVDRRRPGRPESVNPKLLPLLRAEERAKLPAPGPEDEIATWPSGRRLDAGEGVFVGMALGALLWTAIIGATWAALH